MDSSSGSGEESPRPGHQQASVGEKNIEMIPSLIPITRAAAIVPLRLPSPPMMTTMNERRSGSRPIK
jgi:hypothetical protein